MRRGAFVRAMAPHARLTLQTQLAAAADFPLPWGMLKGRGRGKVFHMKRKDSHMKTRDSHMSFLDFHMKIFYSHMSFFFFHMSFFRFHMRNFSPRAGNPWGRIGSLHGPVRCQFRETGTSGPVERNRAL